MMADQEAVLRLPEGSILDPEYHARLLADITAVARQANVPVHMLHKSMVDFCGEEETEWVRDYARHKREGCAGLCFVGKSETSIDTKMMAIACAFIRHYIDARIVTLSQVVQWEADGDMPDPTVLLIPNFFVDMESGKPLAGHQVAMLHSVLVNRLVGGRMTILYASSLDTMGKQYGDALQSFIADHWQLVNEEK